MTTPRLPLYQRLPEIYRMRDTEQQPPGQLKAFVGVLNEVNHALHDDIATLYLDFFIETCNPWVIPYLADLLGVSHLSGDPHDLRADVARTVRNRRRKGTLGAIESVVHALSGWAVHAVEMRDRLFWAQHLNHQRPDEGGVPPLTLVTSISAAARGGTVNLRDPALLSLLDGPFDPFAHIVDVKPPLDGEEGFNLPDLTIFLWRLKAYRVPVSKPISHPVTTIISPSTGGAEYAVRFDIHPMGEPMVLFNTYRYTADADPPNLAGEDAVPGPMPPPRLTQDSPAGRPDSYVRVTTYGAPPPNIPGNDKPGLVLHLPATPFASIVWTIRGANLCAWEAGLRPALRKYEIVVDPLRGRLLFGVMGASTTDEAQPLTDNLLVSASYGFSGPIGAHPIARAASSSLWPGQGAVVKPISFHTNPNCLRDALQNLPALTKPLILEINDSMTHDLNIAVLRLSTPLWIRAAAGQRPVIRLAQPLAFRPDDVTGPNAPATMATLSVTLEGLYLTRNVTGATPFNPNAALIECAALNLLHIKDCTLDPGGSIKLDGTPDGTPTPIREAMRLTNGYGFTIPAEQIAFDQTPEIRIVRSIVGPLAIDTDYSLNITGSIVGGGGGVGASATVLAIYSATDRLQGWGPDLTLDGLTCFGAARVMRASGQGGIWTCRLEVHDNQKGCIRFSYFSGDKDRLPQNHGCVWGTQARLLFTAEHFGAPGYAQLTLCTDQRIREQGPNNDEMGAFGYLMNTHKWKNIGVRLREFMPIGVRPVLFPVT
jgi:hypothetical protein